MTAGEKYESQTSASAIGLRDITTRHNKLTSMCKSSWLQKQSKVTMAKMSEMTRLTRLTKMMTS